MIMEIIKAVIIGALVLIGTVCFFAALWEIVCLCVHYDNEKGHKRIKFSQFLHLFSIAPEKWGMYAHSVVYYRELGIFENFSFSMLDLIKYHKFYKRFNQREKDRENADRMRRVVEEWQRDIDKYKEKHGINTGGRK